MRNFLIKISLEFKLRQDKTNALNKLIVQITLIKRFCF